MSKDDLRDKQLAQLKAAAKNFSAPDGAAAVSGGGGGDGLNAKIFSDDEKNAQGPGAFVRACRRLHGDGRRVG